MKPRATWQRWVLRFGGAVVLAMIVALIWLYATSEFLLRHTWEAPQHSLVVSDDATSIAEGARLAKIRGCNGGCHGRDGIDGEVFVDDPMLGRLIAPNLSEIAQRYSTEQLERAIRHRVKPDGTGVYVMPSAMLNHLDDKDLGAIIAFLRVEPVTVSNFPETQAGPMWRLGLVLGNPMTAPVTADIDQGAEHPRSDDHQTPLANGRYIAMTSCTECHAPNLRGYPGDTPNLVMVAAYSLDDFTSLMRTGRALGNRELNEMMTGVARGRTAHLTDDEIDALHAYLQSLAGESSEATHPGA